MKLEQLVAIKHEIEATRDAANFNRKLNENGDTWQDMAHNHASHALRMIEGALAQALDDGLHGSETAREQRARFALEFAKAITGNPALAAGQGTPIIATAVRLADELTAALVGRQQ